MRQDRRHNLKLDPFREGSNVPDLLGLRMLGRYTADTIRHLLPRVRREQLLEYLGVAQLVWADGPLDLFVPSAAAAVGRADLTGKRRDVVEARRALVDIIGARLRSTQTAALLGIARCTVHRLHHRPAVPVLVQAVRLQVGLRNQVHEEHGVYTKPVRPRSRPVRPGF